MAAKKTPSSPKTASAKTAARPSAKTSGKASGKASGTASARPKSRTNASAPAPAKTKTAVSKKAGSASGSGLKSKTAKKSVAGGGKKAAVKKAAPSKKAVVETDSVVNSVAAAAKRIQERERLRKKKASDRISARVAARAEASRNGHRPELNKARQGKPLTDKDLKKFRALLIEFRDRIVGDITFLTADNLHRVGRDTGADLSGASQHSADHGTDNFDREFALSLATTEQDVLYEVDEALMRIEEGTYGICEMTGVYIEKARLEVIPYTRYSVQAQARMEQGRAKYRPFAQAFRGW